MRHYLATWPLRVGELMGLRGWAAWREGYGPGGPDGAGYGFEAVVRVAELLGVGVVVQVLDALLHRRHTRLLAPREAAFAKTYHAPEVLATAVLQTRAPLAAKLRIAFVLGRVVKAYGTPDAPLLVHELTHVEQFYRWGWAYVAKCLHAQWRGGGYAYVVGSTLLQLNAEQEAAFREDAARVAMGLPTRWARYS